MDDLSKKLDTLLQSPDGMQKIQAAMAALSPAAADTAAPSASTAPDASMLTQLLSGLGQASEEAPAAAESPSGGLPDLSKIMQMMPLLSGFNKDDENTALLKALRPHLHGDREKRLDDAIQMMKWMKLLPLITPPKK